jgi:hypothetical protein
MSNICPCCKQPTDRVKFGVIFPKMKRRIIGYIQSVSGATSKEIAFALYGDEEQETCVRSHITQINTMFEAAESPVRIRGARGWGYRLYGLNRLASAA